MKKPLGPHDHFPGCPYSGMRNDRAWLRHLGAALVGWVVLAVSLWLMIVVVAICLKAIR